MSTAGSTQNAGRTGNTFWCRRRKWSAAGIIPMDETIFAHRRPVSRTHPMRSIASLWEVPREIRFGQRQDAVQAKFLWALPRTDRRGRLFARDSDAALLLRSGVLRAQVRPSHAASRKSGEGVLSRRPEGSGILDVIGPRHEVHIGQS